MISPITGIGAITLRAMRAKLEESAAIARAVEGLALDVEPLATEADQLLQAWRSNGRWGLNCAAGFFPP
jgi:hypothetical protein